MATRFSWSVALLLLTHRAGAGRRGEVGETQRAGDSRELSSVRGRPKRRVGTTRTESWKVIFQDPGSHSRAELRRIGSVVIHTQK